MILKKLIFKTDSFLESGVEECGIQKSGDEECCLQRSGAEECSLPSNGGKEYRFFDGVNVILGDENGVMQQAIYSALAFRAFGEKFPMCYVSLQSLFFSVLIEKEDNDYFIDYDFNVANRYGFANGTINDDFFSLFKYKTTFLEALALEECSLFINRYDYSYSACRGQNYDEIRDYPQMLQSFRKVVLEYGEQEKIETFDRCVKEVFETPIMVPKIAAEGNRLTLQQDDAITLNKEDGGAIGTIVASERKLFHLMCLVHIGRVIEKFGRELKPLLIFDMKYEIPPEFIMETARYGRQVFCFQRGMNMLNRLKYYKDMNIIDLKDKGSV